MLKAFNAAFFAYGKNGNNIFLEIDRLQKTEPYAAGTVASLSRRVLIGRQDDASPVYFEGNIHVTHICDRSLTVEDISELHSYYGYATTNYPGRVLIRKLVCPEPNHGAWETKFVTLLYLTSP